MSASSNRGIWVVAGLLPAAGSWYHGAMERKAKGWIVSGRVQGVGFRYFVVMRARILGLLGWAANLSDGSVEVQAYGSSEGLRSLHGALSAGPSLAKVDSVREVAPAVDIEKTTGFAVRYGSAYGPLA